MSMSYKFTCDHCKKQESFPVTSESKRPSGWQVVTVGGTPLDLCGSCAVEWEAVVKAFKLGRKLQVSGDYNETTS